VDGARHIKLWGESIRVAAAVHTIGGLSAHADQDGLVDWYRAIDNRPAVYLVHGEPEAQSTLAGRLANELGATVRIAQAGERYDLIKSKPLAGSHKAA
jgi:metallo-beta-lactamase family protein